MLDRMLSNPIVALGFIIAVVYLVLYYFAQREQSKVSQMKGQGRFQPKWTSGHRHRRRRSATKREGFQPPWSRQHPPKTDQKPSDSER